MRLHFSNWLVLGGILMAWGGIRPLDAAPPFPSISYTAEANYVGNYVSHVRTGNAVTVTCAGGNIVKVVVCRPGIIRIVLGAGGNFEADVSHAVVNFNWPAVAYTVEDGAGDLVITTDDLYVRMNKNPVRFEFYDKAMVMLNRDLNGLRLTPVKNEAETAAHQISKVLDPTEHIYGLGERNFRTLDHRGTFTKNWNAGTAQFSKPYDYLAYGDIPFYLSNKGYGIYLDNSSESYFDFGKAVPNESAIGINADEVDYYFIAGPSFRKILDGYTQVTGRPFLPPKYMCAYQASRWAYGSRAVVEDIASTFRSKQIPCDVLWVDGPDGGWWTGNNNFMATFNSNFPNPQAMVDKVHGQGFKIALLENVTHSIKGDQYQTGVDNKYYIASDNRGTPWVFGSWGVSGSEVDFRRPGAAAWWGSLHAPLFKMGIDAWWIDENDGEFGEAAGSHWDKYYWNAQSGAWDLRGNQEHNASPLLSTQALYHAQQDYFKQNGLKKRSWVFSRGKYAGMQRAAWTWSADVAFSTWQDMNQQLRWEGNMGMGSIVYGSDIPGCDAIPSDQAYLRWFQMEIFNFFTRTHGSSRPKEPWNFPTVTGFVKNWIEWKYRMMPYIYTGAYEMNQSGIPIHRPLVFDFTSDNAVANMDDEFMFGDWLLVAPVVNGTSQWASNTSRNVYLPAGSWIDYKDGKTLLTGPKTVSNYAADLNTVPLFVKAGAIIPMQPLMQYMGEKPIDLLTLDVYPSGNSSYTMYEDDGNSYDFEKGAWAKTKFDCSANAKNATLTINARQDGGGGFTPDSRDYMVKMHNRSSAIVAVNLNGVPLAKSTYAGLNSGTIGWAQDTAAQIAWVRVKDAAKNMILDVIADPSAGVLQPGVPFRNLKTTKFLFGSTFIVPVEYRKGKSTATVYNLWGGRLGKLEVNGPALDFKKAFGISLAGYIVKLENTQP